MSEYEAVIGLEIHFQASTKTKMFCWCSNDSFGKEPNINVCPICMGHPGQLPVINEEAVNKGIRTGLALGCNIALFSKFDRKNYFYPDLPTGFQISQFDQPIAENGEITITVEGEKKKIGITRLHLENDAGKLTHVSGGSLVDYNRAGSPLMEIVSEPDMRSPEEAVAYAQELQKIARYVDGSDADMEKGMMRFDINVSLMKPGAEKFGTKAEVKNLNSFKALEKALNYEIKRQKEILESGGEVVQETRGWDEASGQTVSQRSKEEAHDYRYFPEPDLPPLVFTEEEIKAVKEGLPEMPTARRERFVSEFGLKEDDARILTDEKALGDYFEKIVKIGGNPQKSASLVLSVLTGLMKKDGKGINEVEITPEDISSLTMKIDAGELSSSAAKVVIEEVYETGKSPDEVISEKNLVQISDEGALAEACNKVVQLNEQSVKDFKEGKERAFGFLVGQVMKETKGKANPQLVSKILKEKINDYDLS